MAKHKNLNKQENFDGDGWDKAVVCECIQSFIKQVNRLTSENNRKRVASILTEAMLEAGAFRRNSEPLNEEMALAVIFERDLYETLKDTKFDCEAIPLEKNFGYVKLVSDGVEGKANPDNALVKEILNLIESEVMASGFKPSGQGVQQLHSRKRTHGVLGNRNQKANESLTGLGSSLHKSIPND